MILSSEISQSDAQQMLEFYKNHFAIVELVSCSKCHSYLAFECSGGDGMGIAPNELGKYVVPIGENLLSHRIRLDEAPTGERMVGYQCGALVPNPIYKQVVDAYNADLATYETQYKKDVAAAKKKKLDEPVYDPPQMPLTREFIECGNDTRISDVERGLVPVGAMQVSLSPFEKHQIREKIKASATHKPDFRKSGNIKHFESFQVERV